MRHRRLTLLSISIVIIALALGPQVTAQETTPVPGAEEETGDVTVELIGSGSTDVLPVTPASVMLARITLARGAALPAESEDPSLALIVIEGGAVTVTMDTPLSVWHPPVNGEPGTDSFESMPAGQTFTMEAGDSVLFPPQVEGELRNDSRRDAVLLAALIGPINADAVHSVT
jgi:quercetin dioxygenase-like cupin family protein